MAKLEDGLVVHDFNESLEKSHAASDLPFWEDVYRKAFFNFKQMVDHRENGEHQKAGIDRSVMLANAERVLVDEKVRGRNRKTGKVYEDVALEYWSDVGRSVPGWVCKPLRADYIAYAIAPIGKCYLLPVLQLQLAWRVHGTRWTATHPEIKAPNRCRKTGRQWVTVSVGVPVPILFAAIGQCLRIDFEPCEVDEYGHLKKPPEVEYSIPF